MNGTPESPIEPPIPDQGLEPGTGASLPQEFAASAGSDQIDVAALIESLRYAQDAQLEAERKVAVMSRAGRIAHYFSRVRQAELEVQAGKLQQVEYRATHDKLTGLYNRDGLALLVEKYMRSSGDPTGVLQLDVANFKSLNDRYGHHKGDDALQLIAAVLSASVRPGDVVVRLGGDEFAILLGVDKHAAEEARNKQQAQPLGSDHYAPRNTSVSPEDAVEAVRSSILERIGFVRQENELWQESGVHLGVGATVWSPASESIDEALTRADIALEADKRDLHAQVGQYRKA